MSVSARFVKDPGVFAGFALSLRCGSLLERLPGRQRAVLEELGVR